MIKTNFHVHSTFCDGRDTPERIAQVAVEKGIAILGFSSHSMYPFSSGWHIPVKDHAAYSAEVARVKKLFEGKLKIWCGFEADYIAGVCAPDFDHYKEFDPDYLIGSVHFVPGDKGFIEADGSGEEVLRGIQKYFAGSAKRAAQEYFALEREMLKNFSFTFLAHPDVIRKPNAQDLLFDEDSSWYKSEVEALAHEIAKSGVCVEINTGGILRGAMKSPYPAPHFLSMLHDLNVPVTINTDAHTLKGLDFWYEEAVLYAKKAGYRELAFFDEGSLKFQRI